MSVDVTYHCQGLTTAAIWDHQLCSSTLSTFLLADGNDMHHHSLITMKATLEDELKQVCSWSMLQEPPTSVTKDLAMATSVTSLKLGTKKPRVWVSGLHTKDSKAPPSTFTQAKVHALVQHFQMDQTTSKPHDKSNITLAIFWRERTLGQ